MRGDHSGRPREIAGVGSPLRKTDSMTACRSTAWERERTCWSMHSAKRSRTSMQRATPRVAEGQVSTHAVSVNAGSVNQNTTSAEGHSTPVGDTALSILRLPAAVPSPCDTRQSYATRAEEEQRRRFRNPRRGRSTPANDRRDIIQTGDSRRGPGHVACNDVLDNVLGTRIGEENVSGAVGLQAIDKGHSTIRGRQDRKTRQASRDLDQGSAVGYKEAAGDRVERDAVDDSRTQRKRLDRGPGNGVNLPYRAITGGDQEEVSGVVVGDAAGTTQPTLENGGDARNKGHSENAAAPSVGDQDRSSRRVEGQVLRGTESARQGCLGIRPGSEEDHRAKQVRVDDAPEGVEDQAVGCAADIGQRGDDVRDRIHLDQQAVPNLRGVQDSP